MRYIFISDVHGQYDKMRQALKKVNFNKEKDTLVNVGDPFDRGTESKQILEFLMSCPHRILIWGNHDARLYQLIRQADRIAGYDFENGMPATLSSFTGISKQAGFDTLLYLFQMDECYKPLRKMLGQYFRECTWAIEFKDLIVTHAWVPVKITNMTKNSTGRTDYTYAIADNWRETKRDQWFATSWCPSYSLWKQKCFPDKQLLIGHCNTWHFNEEVFNYDGDSEATCKIFHTPELIAIDGCSNWINGCVNAYIYETDEEPVRYDG